MVILRRADHVHFMDDIEERHERMRATVLSEDLAWLSKEMRPMAELCPQHQAQSFVRCLTLAHLDAVLKRSAEARRFLAGNLEEELARRGVVAMAHRS
jgi:hypothetical protein